jgi:putative transposase
LDRFVCLVFWYHYKELEEKNERVAQLERKVGQLTYEVDWLKKKSEEIIGPDWEKRFR